jgi:hypothetical protein
MGSSIVATAALSQGRTCRPKTRNQWWSWTWMMDNLRHAHRVLGILWNDVPSAQGSAIMGQTWQWHATWSVPMLGLSALACMTHQQYQQCRSSHKFPNSFHIFGDDACGRSSRSLTVFKGCSSALKPVPLKTLRTTHCLIAISLPKHVQCLVWLICPV